MLKAIVENVDSLPEAIRSYYKPIEDGEHKGKHFLQVEGMVEKSRLDEFRNTNVATAKERDEALKKLKEFDGIDPAKWTSLIDLEKRVSNKDLVDKQGFEKALEERTRSMREDYDGRMTALTTKNSELEALATTAVSRYHRSVIDRDLADAAIKGGIREEALPDVQLRGATIWKFNEKDEIVASANGQVVYGRDGTKPLTMPEWIEELREKAPHLFKNSSGGGAGGGSGAGVGKITKRSQLANAAEKAAFIREKGLPAWEALPD